MQVYESVFTLDGEFYLVKCMCSQLTCFDARYNEIESVAEGVISWCNKLAYCRLANNPVCSVEEYAQKYM